MRVESAVTQTMSHEAMAAAFSIRAAHDDPRYARQAIAAAFAELDWLETQLSRFVEGGDVWRINRLRRGESTVVALDAFRCLQAALEYQAQTGGAFDVAYGSLPRVRQRGKGEGGLPDSDGLLELSPAGCRVRALADGLCVDLGAIGKGYALDVMAETLREWDVAAALLSASTSTLLALDPPPGESGWSVACGPAHNLRRLNLAHEALSGSGIGVKGRHIIDPRTRQPAGRCVQAWARAATAAQADALSTAFMVMEWEEIERCCGNAAAVWACRLESVGGTLRVFPQQSVTRLPEELNHATT